MASPNQQGFTNPSIRKMIVPTDTNAKEYCCNIIKDYNDRKKTSYSKATEEHPKVITYRNGNTNSIIRFITPFGGSVYCFPKGTSFHCIDPHADRDFTNRALRHIAVESGKFDIEDSTGKRTKKVKKCFNEYQKQPTDGNGNVVSKVSTQVCNTVYTELPFLKLHTREKGVRLEATDVALTIRATLTLVDILVLIEFLDIKVKDRSKYHIFCVNVFIKYPIIRKIEFPEGNDETPERYCNGIIEEYNRNTRTDRGYERSEPPYHLQGKVIVYSKPIDSTTTAVRGLTNLSSQRVYLVCFIITNSDSIYCMTKGLKAFKSIERHEDINFASRALHCIATNEVSLIRVKASYGMYASRELRFRDPTISPMIDMSGIVTNVHTWARQNVYSNKPYLQVQNNGVATGARLTSTRSALTICKTLSLTNVVDLIQWLHPQIARGRGYYIMMHVSKVQNLREIQQLEDLDERVGENVTLEEDAEGIYCKDSNGDWLRFHKDFHGKIKDAFTALIRNKFRGDSDNATRLKEPWVNIGRHVYIELYPSPSEYIYEDQNEDEDEGEDEDELYGSPSDNIDEDQNEDVGEDGDEEEDEDDDAPPQNEYSHSEFNYFDIPSDVYNFESEIVLYDLLKIRTNELLLYHVNEGFAKDISKVCQTIVKSAGIIYTARYSGNDENEYLLKLHNLLQEVNHKERCPSFSNAVHRELFRKKFVYVYAFKDVNITPLQNGQWNVTGFTKSEIAMHELLHISKHLESLGFEFRICQIRSEAAGDDESGDDESGDDESGDDESGDDESGDDESGDDESGDDGGNESGDDAGDESGNDSVVVRWC